MKAENSYGLISIGLCIRYFCHLSSYEKVGDLNHHLKMLDESIHEAGFQVAESGMQILKEARDQLKTMSSDEKVGEKLAKEFRDSAIMFEKIVFAEATTKKVYVIPQRRFNTEYLLSNPHRLFKDGLFARLSSLAKSDIHSAGRCILFGEATASAFHILRATEEALKLYYFSQKKTKRLSKPMWAGMVADLRAKTRDKPPKVLLDSLDMVRVSYRNPTQHPDALYDIESAQDLLGVCVDLIGKMASSLPEPILPT